MMMTTHDGNETTTVSPPASSSSVLLEPELLVHALGFLGVTEALSFSAAAHHGERRNSSLLHQVLVVNAGHADILVMLPHQGLLEFLPRLIGGAAYPSWVVEGSRFWGLWWGGLRVGMKTFRMTTVSLGWVSVHTRGPVVGIGG